MTIEQLLVALGEITYGSSWRRDVARELGVSAATVNRIALGGRAGRHVQHRMTIWCRRALARESAQAARRIELYSTGASLLYGPATMHTTEEDT